MTNLLSYLKVPSQRRRRTALRAMTGVPVSTLAGCLLAIFLTDIAAQPSQALAGNFPRVAQQSEIREIQSILKALGFDPGPVDGLVGRKTLAAAEAFRSANRLPAGGELDASLLAALRQALLRAQSSGSSKPQGQVAAGQAPAKSAAVDNSGTTETTSGSAGNGSTQAGREERGQATLIGTRWKVSDPDGASFFITFEDDGRLSGFGGARFWRWSRSADGLRLEYDNKIGTRVVRIGAFQDGDRIAGNADASSGRSWPWSAERQTLPAQTRSWKK